MKLNEIDLYQQVASKYDKHFYNVIKPAPIISMDELDFLIFKCVFWLEARYPQSAFVIIKRYNLDGGGSKSLAEIAELLAKDDGSIGVSLNAARLIMHKALYELKRAYRHGFDKRRIRPKFPATKPKKLHKCSGKTADCVEHDDGTLWLKMGDLSETVKFCPFCGKRNNLLINRSKS